MNESETIADVRAAADAIVAAYGAHQTDDYFQAFHPEATFVFYSSPERFESRAAFREAWEAWEREDGFKVLECVSLGPARPAAWGRRGLHSPRDDADANARG